MERTLVLLKPDAVQKNISGAIISRFEQKGLKIIGAKMMALSTELLASHYAHLADKPFFPRICSYMQTGPVLALALEGESCVEVVRKLSGPTNPLDAAPGTIRWDFAKSMENNIIHSSDSVENGNIEIARFFQEPEIFVYERTLI